MGTDGRVPKGRASQRKAAARRRAAERRARERLEERLVKKARAASVTAAALLLPALLGVSLAGRSGWLAFTLVALSYLGGTTLTAVAYRMYSLLLDVRGEVRTLVVEHVIDLEESLT